MSLLTQTRGLNTPCYYFNILETADSCVFCANYSCSLFYTCILVYGNCSIFNQGHFAYDVFTQNSKTHSTDHLNLYILQSLVKVFILRRCIMYSELNNVDPFYKSAVVHKFYLMDKSMPNKVAHPHTHN